MTVPLPDLAGDIPELGALAGLAIELARGAAALVAGADSADYQVAAKSTSTDLVTAVDTASERWLVAQLAERRPGDAVLGEEGGGRPGTTPVRWVVDPIDGTVNFVLGLPLYAVSVAAEVRGQVVVGAVCNPATGELFHARLGGGAYLDGQRLSGPREVGLERAVIGTGFGYGVAQRSRQARVAAQVLPRIADIRRLGAASLDLCNVACGRLDGYWEAGLNPWDYAAGALIAREAGCVTSGLRGSPVSPRLALACAPRLAPALIALLEELDADAVTDDATGGSG